MDVAVTLTSDKTAWLVQIAATGDERARNLADLEEIVGVYHEVKEWTYQVAGHREAELRRFAEEVRAHGGVITWGARRQVGRRGHEPAPDRERA